MTTRSNVVVPQCLLHVIGACSQTILLSTIHSRNKIQRPFDPIETDFKSLGTPLVLSHPLRFVKSSGSNCMVSDDFPNSAEVEGLCTLPILLDLCLGHGLFTSCAMHLAYRPLLRPEVFLTH